MLKRCFFILTSILIMMHIPVVSQTGKCEEGLLRCSIAAGATLLGNPAVGAGFAAWCMSGYLWCVQYYPQESS
jgi:hypothetical protein